LHLDKTAEKVAHVCLSLDPDVDGGIVKRLDFNNCFNERRNEMNNMKVG